MTTQTYGMVVTAAGAAKLAVALAGGAAVSLKDMVLGDGAGTPYVPTRAETALRREVARVPVETVAQDPVNPPWARVTGVIPAATGGFTIREIGLYDTAGTLFAIGNYPETYKPVVAEGASFDAPITVILQVGSASAVTITLDASLVYATRQWVLANVEYFAVKSATVAASPATPSQGDKYLIPPAGGSGAFAGKSGLVALYRGSADGWLFINPASGSEARAADTGLAYERTTAGWRPVTASPAEVRAGTDAVHSVTPATLRAELDFFFGEDRLAFYGSI
ncbi:MAG: phage tail protein [Methylobacterium sp.]|uniref:phage tail-collar fiber domain-containing protein n=1 Tax=Methylobacterium sp. TaxID=409 RepID=UPI002718AD8E|nr:phage tail protein [Methylobacterium sp.]MDO9428446.1 phage tail protein [Methylobacterium sp.]